MSINASTCLSVRGSDAKFYTYQSCVLADVERVLYVAVRATRRSSEEYITVQIYQILELICELRKDSLSYNNIFIQIVNKSPSAPKTAKDYGIRCGKNFLPKKFVKQKALLRLNVALLWNEFSAGRVSWYKDKWWVW